MRVTNQMMAQSSLLQLNNLRSRMAGLTEQISSGKRITKASEDPVAAGDTMRIQARAQALVQWQANVENATDWVRSTESQLDHMINLMGRARDIAVAGSNQALDDASRAAHIPELSVMIDQMIDLLNAEGPGGWLFGGHRTQASAASPTVPFEMDKNTGVITSTIAPGAITRDVGPGISMTVNISGERLGDWTTNDNPLSALYELREALGGSGEDVRATFDNLKGQFERMVTLRSEMGAADRRLEHLTTKNQEQDIYLGQLLNQAQGVELEKAIMDLSQADLIYRAALQVGARIFPPTLADFLR